MRDRPHLIDDEAPDEAWDPPTGHADVDTAHAAHLEAERGPSKSQLKREKHALQALAERMAGMPRAELERLGLSAATWAALEETKRIKDIRALGRHWKRIANLLEREDMAAVHALVDDAESREREAAARHQTIERWRERLLAEDDRAMGAFIEACPSVDRQQLRALIRAARRDQARGRPDAARKLFRFLRDVLDGGPARSSDDLSEPKR
jgi:ribosome-associated protein